MAAGFDKHGEAIDGLFDLGFGYVEIGSVTPLAQVRAALVLLVDADGSQPGNPKPRVFRIPESNALVNRYGFNSEGHLSVIARLRNRVRQFVADNALVLPASIFPPPPANALPNHDVVAQLLASADGEHALVVDSVGIPRSLKPGKVLAINLGKNKASEQDSIEDFVQGVHAMGPYADVLVVNVSSPNTPGLRNLQRKGVLEELLQGVVAARNSLTAQFKPPVLVKVAPDLDADQLADIAQAVLSSGIDGIIISNTTITRPASAGNASELLEAGGLSGPPVKPLALAALSALHAATGGKVPLIGCGGITTGQDAIDFAKAGATLVQMYTSFIYEGVGLPRKLKDEVTAILEKENTTWAQIIGTAVPVLPLPIKTIPVVEIEVVAVPVEKVLVIEIPKQEKEEVSTELLQNMELHLEVLLEELAASHVPVVSPVATEAEILAVIVPAFAEDAAPIEVVPALPTNEVLLPATTTASPSVVLEALATTVTPPTVEAVEPKSEIAVAVEPIIAPVSPPLQGGKRWV